METYNSNDKVMTTENIISAALGRTTFEMGLIKTPVLSEIIASMPPLPFEGIKREEMILHNEENKLKKINNGKEEEVDPKVTLSEKYIYINRVLGAIANNLGSGVAEIYGELYYYNRSMWVSMSEQTASNFISLIVQRAGLYTSFVSNFRVKKTMYKQLNADLLVPDEMITAHTAEIMAIANLRNGTIKINEEGEAVLHQFSKEDYLCYQLEYDYDPTATCPLFDKFLDEVLPEKAAQDLLMEMIGYCFIPTQRMKLERSLMLYGPGANGKGVVFDIVVAILGEEHVSGFTMEALSHDPNARAQLKNKLLNYATELGGKCDADMIKKLISGEPVHVKTLYKDVTMMKNYPCKFIFNTNALPRGAENTNAFFRRWEILPFDVEIPPEKRDIHLSKKLKTELSGIFNRVLAGIKRLIENKDFTKSELSAKMLEEYQFQSNSVLRFIKEENWVPTVDKKETAKISSIVPHIAQIDFYAAYKTYCEISGCAPSSNVDFGRKIRQHFKVQEGSTKNANWVFAKSEKIQIETQEHNSSSDDSNDDIINQIINDIK